MLLFSYHNAGRRDFVSKTRKERHQYKRRERRRTGMSDPSKIRLHRKRFLERLETRQQAKPRHHSLRLVYLTEGETILINGEDVISVLPYPVEDQTALYHLIYNSGIAFDVEEEKTRLSRHRAREKALGKLCYLSKITCGIAVCSSVIACPRRKWDGDQQLPLCTL
ncbi:MAG: hypothetical protein HW405_999 [Candidatus Berkelbacteria bacterium]|nr:hypothetical protein [Candidatus Berkelbacteria bacterium]